MTAVEVFHDLSVRDIRLRIDGDQLRYDAPAGAVTAEVMTLLRQHKPGLLALLWQETEPVMVRAEPSADEASPAAPSTQEACTDQEHFPPPRYPGHPVGAPFRPGHQVWLYRWDDQTPRFATPVTIVRMRTLWPGEQDIGWRNAAGAVTWHNARLAVAVET